MFEIARTPRGVPIRVHWTVPLLAIVAMIAGWRELAVISALVAGYVAMLVIHELGHHIVATRRRHRVFSIEIYPFHGECRYEQARSPWDRALIAWGGVIAQALVALPCMIVLKTDFIPSMGALNAALWVLAAPSLTIAALNLLPIAPLDGRDAWTILPLALKRRRKASIDMTPMEALEEALRKATKRAQ